MNIIGLLYAAITIATEITLAPIVVTFATGLIIPVLVGLVTKSGASPGVKQACTVVLAGIAALITSSILADGSAVFSMETLLLAGMNWLIAITSYLGLYQPRDLNDSLAPNRGLGSVIETSGFEKG